MPQHKTTLEKTQLEQDLAWLSSELERIKAHDRFPYVSMLLAAIFIPFAPRFLGAESIISAGAAESMFWSFVALSIIVAIGALVKFFSHEPADEQRIQSIAKRHNLSISSETTGMELLIRTKKLLEEKQNSVTREVQEEKLTHEDVHTRETDDQSSLFHGWSLFKSNRRKATSCEMQPLDESDQYRQPRL